MQLQGRIQDFKLGGGGALKKIEPSGERCENFWSISCEKSHPILGGRPPVRPPHPPPLDPPLNYY
jgi:hypothetical protein